MYRLRILFAWLLMAAVPMQGFAAASMLLCSTGAQQHVHAAAQSTTSATAHHDHAIHGQAAQDKGHRCSICATCCNSMALIAPEHTLAVATVPQSFAAEPQVRVFTRPAPLPDKPPRA